MKNKYNIPFFVCLILGVLNVNAQTNDFYYTTNGNKINLTKISDKNLVEFSNGLGISNTMNPNNLPGIKLSDKRYIVLNTANLSSYKPNSKQ